MADVLPDAVTGMGCNVMYFHNSPHSIDWMTPTVRSRPNSSKAAVLGAEPIILRP